MQHQMCNRSLSESWIPSLPEKDARIDGWLLLGNPVPIVAILAGYVYFVKVSKVSSPMRTLRLIPSYLLAP